MSRRLPLVLAAVAIFVFLLIGAAIWHYLARQHADRTQPEQLAAALPPEDAADFAAAQPVIDELRHLRGSVLDGTSLATPAGSGSPPDNSYVELLRREARRLDSLAADCEDQRDYDRADAARTEAQTLWRLAREQVRAHESLVIGSSTGDR